MATTIQELEIRVAKLETALKKTLIILSQLSESQKLFVTGNQVGVILAQKQKDFSELEASVELLEAQMKLIIEAG